MLLSISVCVIDKVCWLPWCGRLLWLAWRVSLTIHGVCVCVIDKVCCGVASCSDWHGECHWQSVECVYVWLTRSAGCRGVASCSDWHGECHWQSVECVYTAQLVGWTAACRGVVITTAGLCHLWRNWCDRYWQQ